MLLASPDAARNEWLDNSALREPHGFLHQRIKLSLPVSGTRAKKPGPATFFCSHLNILGTNWLGRRWCRVPPVREHPYAPILFSSPVKWIRTLAASNSRM